MDFSGSIKTEGDERLWGFVWSDVAANKATVSEELTESGAGLIFTKIGAIEIKVPFILDGGGAEDGSETERGVFFIFKDGGRLGAVVIKSGAIGEIAGKRPGVASVKDGGDVFNGGLVGLKIGVGLVRGGWRFGGI